MVEAGWPHWFSCRCYRGWSETSTCKADLDLSILKGRQDLGIPSLLTSSWRVWTTHRASNCTPSSRWKLGPWVQQRSQQSLPPDLMDLAWRREKTVDERPKWLYSKDVARACQSLDWQEYFRVAGIFRSPSHRLQCCWIIPNKPFSWMNWFGWENHESSKSHPMISLI